MSTASSSENLSRHYERVYDVESDFRNYNLSLLIASLVRGRRVLDLGCGSGFLLDFLSTNGFKTTGLEPNDELIGLARNRNPSLDIKKGNAEDIDSLFLDEADSILAIDVIEHIENDVQIIKKIHRHLHVNGRFIVVVPAYRWLYGRRDKKYGHFRRYSMYRLESLFISEGLKVVYSRYWNMLGVLPYIFYEKILRRELETRLREKKSGIVNKALKKILHFWFRFVENKINFGFGLSIIIVAEKVVLP